MFADPITVGADQCIFEASGPFTGAATNWDAVVLNRVVSDGPKGTIYRPSAAILTSLSLSSVTLRVQHSPTNQGRTRSLFRVDCEKLDALLKPHGTSIQLVVDTESTVSAEQQASLKNALELFLRLLVEGDGDLTDAFNTTEITSQLLNGES